MWGGEEGGHWVHAHMSLVRNSNTLFHFAFCGVGLVPVSIQPIVMLFVPISSSQVCHCFDAMSLLSNLLSHGLKGSQ